MWFTLDNLSYIIRYNLFFPDTYEYSLCRCSRHCAKHSIYGSVCLSLSIRVKARNPFPIWPFFTLLFNGGMIPTFLVVKSTGLLNSLWSLIIPSIINPFNVF